MLESRVDPGLSRHQVREDVSIHEREVLIQPDERARSCASWMRTASWEILACRSSAQEGRGSRVVAGALEWMHRQGETVNPNCGDVCF